MHIAWQFTPYVLPLVGAALFTALVAVAASRRRAPGVIPFALLMAAVSLWSAASTLEIGATDVPVKLLATQIEYFGVVSVPVAWLGFALRYTGRLGHWGKRLLAVMSVEAVLTAFFAWTNGTSGLIWSAMWLDESGPIPILAVTHGWWFWVHACSDYTGILLGTGLLVRTILKSSRLFRPQTWAVLLGSLAPWVANALYLLDWSPIPGVDLTPFAFSLSGLGFAWGLLRLGLLDAFVGLIPVARDAIVESMRDGVFVLDRRDHIVDLNPAAEHVVGQKARATIGRSLESVLDGWPQLADASRADEHTEATLGVGAARRSYDILSAPLDPHGARELGRLVVLRDITERKEAEAALRDSEARYRQQYKEMPLPTYSWRKLNEDFVLEDCNRAADETTGGRVRGWIGHLASERMIERPNIFADLHACAAGQRTLRREVQLARGPDGRERCLAVTCVFVPPETVMVHTEDLTDRRQAEVELRHQALHDGLTGLPNRVLLNERLEQAIQTSRRDAATFALLLIDLDRFKDVNDALGHSAGDALLRLIGPRLAGVLSEADTLARLGGDEFAVLLPWTDEVAACDMASRLVRAFNAVFPLDAAGVDVGGSIGVVVYPQHGADAETLMKRADSAMYVAKRAGGGWAEYHPDQDHRSSERLALRMELKQAIERGELVLYYQPKRLCLDGSLAGVEALVRWQHPRRGLIMPDEFIPLAEQTGLISSLTVWVIEAAIRQCRAWHDLDLNIPVAVNLSVRDLHDPHMPETIECLLHEWQVPARLLHVEITESSLMIEPERALQTVARLRSLGLQISIDDFGTGYSSLAYLKNLPVDELKIDRSFVCDVGEDASDRAIIRSTIELAHILGLRVVAEGVEDEATWRLLTDMGCDEAQGYLLGYPRPAAELNTSRIPHAPIIQLLPAAA